VPGVLGGRVEARPALGLREQFAAQVPGEGSMAAIALGPKAGSSIPRAMAWKGGSEVIGGDSPMGAGRSSGPGRLADHDRAGGEVLGVVGHLRDQLVGHREPRPAVPVAVRDRAALAQALPDRVGSATQAVSV
jgi:hypothetical protein